MSAVKDTDVDTDQAELDYLRWFYANTDFGPAHSDVVGYMEEGYVEETGHKLPKGYGPEE